MIYMHWYALQLNQYFLKFSKKKLIAVNKRTFQTQISCHIVILVFHLYTVYKD